MRVLGLSKQSDSLAPNTGAHEGLLNLPNLLTVVRILLIPVFVVLFYTPTPGRSLAAAFVFGVAASTDWLDGYLARRHGQITRLGRLLDPIADKLLVLSGLILLVQFQQVSALVALLLIAREMVVTGVRAIAAAEGIILSAETTGKYKMVAQVVAIVFLILANGGLPPIVNFHLVGSVFLYLALVLALLSGGQYLVHFWKQVSADKAG